MKNKINEKNKLCKYVIFTIYVFIGMISCNNKEKQCNAQVVIKLPVKGSGKFIFKNFIDHTVYVKLQTDSNFIIRKINRINIFDKKIFIHDSKLKSLFVFDMTGKFLYKIHKVGMGPEEYNSFTSFSIDRNKKLVFIHDLSKNYIYKYSTHNGEFKGVIRIKDRKSFARDISVLDNGDFLCYSSEKQSDAMCGIWVIDSEGNFKKKLWEQTEVYPVTPSDPSPILIKQLKDSLYSVFDVVNNVIYHYDGLNFTKVYQFDFSNLPITTISMHPGITNMKRFDVKMKDIVDIAYVQETSKFIFTMWFCNEAILRPFYIKDEKKLIVAETAEFINGLLGTIVPTDNVDIMCFEIGAWDCERLSKDNNIDGVVKNLISATKMDDNPILQIHYMKK